QKVIALAKEAARVAQNLVVKLHNIETILSNSTDGCRLQIVAAGAAVLVALGALGAFIAAFAADAIGVGEIIQVLAVFGGIGAILFVIKEVLATLDCLGVQLEDAKNAGDQEKAARLEKTINDLKSTINGIQADIRRLQDLITQAKNLASQVAGS